MKIVYLYSSLAIWGGVERVLVDKMNYLVYHDYEVFIITSDQGQHPVPYKLDERVHFYDLHIFFYSQYQYRGWKRLSEGKRLNRLYHQRLKEKLNEIRPDVLVCTTSQDVQDLLCFKGRIPLVVESHVNFIHPDSLLHHIRTLYNNYWIGKADAVVTLTQGDANNWKHVSRHVHVIPNIVHLNDTGQFSECSNKRAIFVGRLVEQKGISDLIKVWQIVNQRHSDWQLDVYGDGKMDSIPEINLYVHHPTENIIEEYLDSSMLLMTSVYEPFGLVLPEAMSCGLPVIAFDCPYGPSDVITNGVDGFLVRDRNLEVFADKVCLLMEDHELRVEMGEAGIVSSQRFSAHLIMPIWKQLFESI